MSDDSLAAIAAFLDVVSLGRFGRVSTATARVAALEPLWRRHCRAATAQQSPAYVRSLEAARRSRATWRGWRALWPRIPHVRTDVAYVLKESYMRKGVVDMFSGSPGLIEVVSHRCLRFYAGGRLQFTNTPGHVAARTVALLYPSSRKEGVYHGSWRIDGAAVALRVHQPNALVKYELRLEPRWEGDGCCSRLRVRRFGFLESTADDSGIMPLEGLAGDAFDAHPLVRVV
uniref:F-box protein Hrt3/FBXO9 C-terminal domain-containing protein n=1 Tax=Bicosoecida sp. CB-2014 TaxID=1486930 RepID=A0A7S1CFL9_9STRA